MEPHVPFAHRCKIFITFWAITIPLTLLIVPLLTLAVLNPLWFRDDAFRALQNFIRDCAQARSRVMKPMLQKYKLFEKLKSYNSSNTNNPNVAKSP